MNTVPSLGEDKLSQLNLNSPRNMKYLPPGTTANHDRVRIMGMAITECFIKIKQKYTSVSENLKVLTPSSKGQHIVQDDGPHIQEVKSFPFPPGIRSIHCHWQCIALTRYSRVVFKLSR